MKLNEYPNAIAKLQRQILDLEQHLIGLQETLSILSLELEKQVIADASLTNDTKRKARRLELQQSDLDYCKASIELKMAQAKRDALEIDLQLLHNQFSVLKLEERKALAKLSAGIAAMELHASTVA
jgi:SMC interacting uncharacterized protein involved in chromosome segregation